MSIPLPSLSVLLPAGVALSVAAVATDQEVLQISVESTWPCAVCPCCATPSTHSHGRYTRYPADLPWGGWRVVWQISVRRFRCTVADCPRRTFGERFESVIGAFQRQTRRLQGVLQALGLAVGGAGGARLARCLHIAISPSTLLRRVRRQALAQAGTVRVLGVDDFAFRRGHRYGTILVDLERHAVIDLLADRRAETLAAWLREHPGIEIISRDRAGAYADAARQGAPEAVQVADRWHLLKNLREVLERVLTRHAAALKAVARPLETPASRPAEQIPDAVPARGETPAGDTPPAGLTPLALLPAPAPTPAQQVQAQRRGRRLALYQSVVQRHQVGDSIRAIAKDLGLHRQTVRRHLRAGTFLERPSRPPAPGKLDPFRSYLRQRWEAGCHSAAVLYQELRQQGYTGGISILRQALAPWRATAAAGRCTATVPKPSVPSPRQVSFWLLNRDEDLPPERQAFVERLLDHVPELQTGQELGKAFLDLVRQRQASALEPWLGRVDAAAVPEFQRFAQGLRQDNAAVLAALTLPWSNGQVEGQVNRLKCLKRQMYGRASFELLRARVLNAP